MFLIVAMASAIKTLGSNVVMQRVTRRQPKATDYRLVQGSVNANAVGTLISGIAGILPPGSYEATRCRSPDLPVWRGAGSGT